MGWFSADEILQNTSESDNSTVHTAALCVLAIVAVSYLVAKVVTKLHKQQTERVAERTARLATVSSRI